jgi:acyl carrier protein
MISIDLAAVESAGFVAENPDIKIVGFRETTPVKLSEFFAVMNYAITTAPTDADSRQLTVGHGMDTAGSPWDAKFSHLRAVNSGRNKAGSSDASVDYKKKLGAAKSMKKAEQIVFEALAERLNRILGIAEEDIDETKSIAKHGGDSLVAVELRNWLSMNLGASIPMLDIVKEIPLREFTLNVATASTFTNPALLDSSISTVDGNTDSEIASNGTPNSVENGTTATSVATTSPVNGSVEKDEIPEELKMIDGDRVAYEIRRHLITQKEIKAELEENLKK